MADTDEHAPGMPSSMPTTPKGIQETRKRPSFDLFQRSFRHPSLAATPPSAPACRPGAPPRSRRRSDCTMRYALVHNRTHELRARSPDRASPLPSSGCQPTIPGCRRDRQRPPLVFGNVHAVRTPFDRLRAGRRIWASPRLSTTASCLLYRSVARRGRRKVLAR